MIKDLYMSAQNIQFTKLQAYLRATGWSRVEAERNNIVFFEKEHDGQHFETTLPLDKAFADYGRRIVDVLNEIARLENREIYQVITDLSHPPSDVVRFRKENRDTVDGTISFIEGFNLLENAQKSLYTAACDLLRPEKYHKRLGLKGADQFIKECRLGQTEVGSYIATVVCPFINPTEEAAQQLTLFNTPDERVNSFTRKVTLRLMESLQTLKTEIDNGSQNRIVDLQEQNIISANFLESISSLNTEQEDGVIEIGTSWSHLAPVPNVGPSVVRFTVDYFPVIENLIEQIRPVDEGVTDTFTGKISLVKADPDPNTRTEGEIVLNCVMGNEEKVSKAKVTLNAADYHRACEAHDSGHTVIIKGKLLQSGRTKYIENPTFQVVA